MALMMRVFWLKGVPMIIRYDFVRFQPFQEPSDKSCQAFLTKAQTLADFSEMSLLEALNTPLSICEMYFSSELWSERKQTIEKKLKLHNMR